MRTCVESHLHATRSPKGRCDFLRSVWVWDFITTFSSGIWGFYSEFSSFSRSSTFNPSTEGIPHFLDFSPFPTSFFPFFFFPSLFFFVSLNFIHFFCFLHSFFLSASTPSSLFFSVSVLICFSYLSFFLTFFLSFFLSFFPSFLGGMSYLIFLLPLLFLSFQMVFASFPQPSITPNCLRRLAKRKA